MNILLAISGGIAAYKSPRLVTLFKEAGHEVRVIATPNSLRFVSPLTLAALSGHPVLSDLWEGQGDYEMHHIRLPEWADLLLVAPASANVIAKAAQGLCDDLVSTTLLAVGSGSEAVCPVVFAPAMNTRMYGHAATQDNLQTLRSRGAVVIEPESGRLACRDEGIGRMPEPEALIAALRGLGWV
jgi:phosphopantothenoylcysteine decarboxylase/phosphopantothenate--cysteine ligase